MTAQVTQFGDMALVNHLSGQAVPQAAAFSSPPTWFPGLYWYDTTNALMKQWNNTAWVSSPTPGNRYLALLTADPVANGVVNITDPGFVEWSPTNYTGNVGGVTTSANTRNQVTFGKALTAYPSTTANTQVISWTVNTAMTVPVQWVALVTDSGTAGLGFVLASWVMAQAYMPNVSQEIQIGIGQLALQGN